MKTSGLAVLGALTAAVAMASAGVAQADESHTDSHNAPRVTLISTGQIDDPLEDVLEHAALFGATYVYD
ncbi:hypothetical protein OG883_20655 [Streptomyces sp. NBC_01142]|uniref:hypothetical protein n=1 Tax=Streptomyces sp. NBC_01142 TaxID=2975865 RepID=UPI00224ED787|nr:hypothetical protein [Streptomyces sp. NBC_01142]MCX4822253.1 hypothetical protein [Streptomyces sp. NBC_01142]